MNSSFIPTGLGYVYSKVDYKYCVPTAQGDTNNG